MAASRIVVFGGEGVEGPPGQINVPVGRGILGYSNGQIFGVPAPDGSADGVTVLQMDPSSADFFKLPKIPDNMGPSLTGYILQWEDGEGGYTLRPPPAEWPSTGGDLALVGVDSAGIPQAYPFGFAGDGAIPRVVGTSIAFSQLFNAKGLVIAAANGSHSYLQQQGIVYTAADGTVFNLSVGYGMRINGSTLETHPSEVAQLSGGKTLATNARGKTLRARFELKNSVVANMAIGTTHTIIGSIPLGLCDVGDEIIALFQGNAGSGGTQHITRMRITNNATPDLTAAGGATVRGQGFEYFHQTTGNIHNSEYRHTVTVAENLWLHVMGRSGGGAIWVVSDKEIFAEIYTL